MKRSVIFILGSLMAFGFLFSKSMTEIDPLFVVDSNHVCFDGNLVFSWLDAKGHLISSDATGWAGMRWPKEDSTGVGFTSGLGVTAKVDGAIRTAWIEYNSEFVPGPISQQDQPDSSVKYIYATVFLPTLQHVTYHGVSGI